MPASDQVALLDLLLALGVPVADPPPGHFLKLKEWSRATKGRDLTALAADPRFRDSFRRGLDAMVFGYGHPPSYDALLASPGGRRVLAGWTAALTCTTGAWGLPGLVRRLEYLEKLPGRVLALAEKEVRELASTGLAELLARTLRGGLFNELHWPAWDEALTALGHDLRITSAWPYLIVSNAHRTRVIGPEGTVLVHDLRIPADDLRGRPSFDYVDGELLVHWRSRRRNDTLVGYWHTRPDLVRPLEGEERRDMFAPWYWTEPCSLPFPGGGRVTGSGVLHRGDTVLPPTRLVIGDGTSYWSPSLLDDGARCWYVHDPHGGKSDRLDVPAFFAEAARRLPAGSAVVEGSSCRGTTGPAR